MQPRGARVHELRGHRADPRAADDLLVRCDPGPVAEVLEEAPGALLAAAALDRALAGRGQVLLDTLRQPGDLRVVEQAAHDAGAVATEGRGDGRQVAGHGASASAPRA